VLAEGAYPEKLLLAHANRGWSEYFLGHFTSARTDFEKSIALYDTAVHDHDATLGALHWLALTLWALGYPDQALSRCAEVEALAGKVADPFVRCFAVHAGAVVHHLRREPAASANYADAMIALADDQGFPHYAALGGAFRSLSLIQQGKGGTRELATIQEAIDSLRAMGSLEPALRVKTFLAQAYLELNDLDAALEVGREGLRVARQYAQGEFEPLFLKLLADVLLAGRDSEAEAENFYREAITVARRQGEKSRELQAAVGLARFWSSHGQQREAYELLAPLYNWFTEGFDTKDLKEAKALLEELSV